MADVPSHLKSGSRLRSHESRLKRLLTARDATSNAHTSDPATRSAAIVALIRLLVATLNEIDRLTAADTSTGS